MTLILPLQFDMGPVFLCWLVPYRCRFKRIRLKMNAIDHVTLFMGVVIYVVVYEHLLNFDACSSFSFGVTASGCFQCWYVP